MLDILIGAGCLVCAFRAVREKRLLVSALWLALASAFVSWFMYRLGAFEVAVVELSVGAGLVTVLFVFAINIAGGEEPGPQRGVPRPLAWAVIACLLVLLAAMILPEQPVERFLTTLAFPTGTIEDFRRMTWQERSLDTLLQVALVFSGVIAVVGLLGSKLEEERE